MLSDDELLKEAMCSLTSLAHIRLCGVPAFNDNTMEPVSNQTVWGTCLQ